MKYFSSDDLIEQLKRSPRAKRLYRERKLPALINGENEINYSEQGVMDFLAPVYFGEVRLRMAEFRRLMSFVIVSYPTICDSLIFSELASRKKSRFSLAEYEKWFEELYGRNNSCFDLVKNFFEQAPKRGLEISEKLVIKWALRAFEHCAYRTGGNMIFAQNCSRSYLLSANDIYHHTLRVAGFSGDHGLFRMFPLLLIRTKLGKRGPLSRKRAEAIASIIHTAYKEDKSSDPGFIPSNLLDMVREQFTRREYEKVLRHFRKLLIGTEDARRQEFNKIFKMGGETTLLPPTP